MVVGGFVPTPPKRVRFGAFELDERSGELRRDGLTIRLAEQPFTILRSLLEKPGQVVTREELRHRLWSADTFVDFEQSLNAAVKRLREALGDSSDHPRYVETLPRRGYRLLVSIDRVEQQPAKQTALGKEQSADRNWQTWAVYVLTALLFAGLILAALHLGQGRKTISLAVLPCVNLNREQSGNGLCEGLSEALVTELGQLHGVRVISRQSVERYRNTTKPIPKIAGELGVYAILEIAALEAEDKVRISAQLIRARPEDHLWAASFERDKSDVISLEREVARAIAAEVQRVLLPPPTPANTYAR